MSAADIFWSFPPGVKQMIFDNLLQEEKVTLCDKTRGIYDICKDYFPTLGNDVARGDIERVEFLLKRGADINKLYDYSPSNLFVDIYHHTPLGIAVSNGNRNMVKFLLESGADINTKNPRTEIKPWFYIHDVSIAELFLEYGADINELDIWGHNLLYSSPSGSSDLTKFLIDKGINIDNIDDFNGNTVLMCYAKEPLYADFVELLLELGANPNIKNKKGRTALDIALTSKKNKRNIANLKKYGAKKGSYL